MSSSFVGRVDRLQRERRVLGVPLAVVYKYFDDQGPFMSAALTYYAFVAIFPLLLIFSSVLGWLLRGNESLQERLLVSTLANFPIVGEQLAKPDELTGSALSVAIGLLVALYGVTGLGQAAQTALNTAWAVPRNSRLNPVVGRFRSVMVMVFGGLVVVFLSVASSFLTNVSAFGIEGGWTRVLSLALSLAVTASVFSLMMRYTTSRRPSFRTSLPGGIFIAVGWHLLQVLGGAYVGRVVTRVDEVNAIFAVVLGLMVLIYLAAVITVLGVEVSVVLRRRLYPRALLTPFTDAVELTDADRRAYDSYAKAQRHKGFQHVDVTFDEEVIYEPEFDTSAIPRVDKDRSPTRPSGPSGA